MAKFALCSDSNGTTAYVSSAEVYGKIISDSLGFDTFTNYSVSGYTSAQIEMQVNSAIGAGNDLIFVNAGTNDYTSNLTGDRQNIQAGICANIRKMIDAVQSAGKKIIVCSPILPKNSQYAQFFLTLEFLLSELCYEKNVDFIPLSSWMATNNVSKSQPAINAYYLWDGFHGLTEWHSDLAGFVLNRQHNLNGAPPPVASEPILLDLGTTGANGSSTFADNSTYTRTITAVGNAQINNNELLLDGYGDWLTIPDSTDWAFGTDDFILEATIKYAVLGGAIFCRRSGAGDYILLHNTSGITYFQVILGGSILLNAQWSWSPSVDVYYDLKIERDGSDFKFYVDEVEIGTKVTSAISIPNYIAPLGVGADPYSGGLCFNGRINDIKITKGGA